MALTATATRLRKPNETIRCTNCPPAEWPNNPSFLSSRDALRAQLAFVDTERPVIPPVWRAILVGQIAKMVPAMFGERHLGELDGSPGCRPCRLDSANSPGSPCHCGRHRDARTEPVSRRRNRVAARRKALADDWGTPGLCKGASCKRELRRGVTDRSFGPRFDRKWWRR